MKKIIHTTKAPAPLGPYNQGIAIDGVLYVSGQIAIHPETGRLENKDIQTETVRVMKNIEAILREAGTTFENVVKTSILLTNMDDYDMEEHNKKLMIWLTIIPLVIFVIGFVISFAFDLGT